MYRPDVSAMITVYVVMLRKGPRWAMDRSDQDPLHQRHLDYLRSLQVSGDVVMLGPVFDESDLQGFAVYRVESLGVALALAEADPAVQAGRFVLELHPWMVEKRVLPEQSPSA